MLSIDGVDFRFPGKPTKAMRLHKFKKCGVRYEIGISIVEGDICWLSGPFPCGKYPDINIFRIGLKDCLEDGERVEADKGYLGECPEKVKAPSGLYMHDEEIMTMKKNVGGRHETVNSRLKTISV